MTEACDTIRGVTGTSTTAETPLRFAARNLKWNASVLLLEAGAFIFGLAVFDASTVFPVLMNKLGSPDWLIGVTRFLQVIGFAVPSLIAAHYIHGRPFHKRFMVGTAGVGRALVQTLWPMLLFCGRDHPRLVLLYLVAVYSIFWLADGFCAVSWTEIVAKAVPAEFRGRFFGLIQSVGGIVAVVAGGIVAWVLESNVFRFPENYAILAGFWAFSAALSFTFLANLREPAGTQIDASDKPAFVSFLKEMVPLLKRYPRLRSIVLLRWTLDGTSVATAYYVLHARQKLGVAVAAAGAYLIAKNIGKIATGPLWGMISDRFSPILTVRIIAACMLAVPVLGVLSEYVSPLLMIALFFLMGTTEDGLWTTCQNLLYASVEEVDRPMAIGVATAALSLCALYSLVGGLVATFLGYQATFVLAAFFGTAGLIVALRVP